MPRDIPKEPPQIKERRITLEEPWPLPPWSSRITSPTTAIRLVSAAHRVEGALRRPELADLSELVYDKQLAVAAFGGQSDRDPNLFYAVAIVQPGKKPEDAINALIAELDWLKNEPISDRELERSKNSLRATTSWGGKRPGQGAVLAHAVVIHNNISTADGEFDIFQNITKADVQRVARTFFTPENRLVITVMPGKSGAAPGR